MAEDETNAQRDQDADRAGEWGRRAGRFLKKATPQTQRFLKESGPRVQKAGENARRLLEESRPKLDEASRNARKMLDENRPRIEKARQDAVRYAHEHEDEIRAAALHGARMRFGGPLGLIIHSLSSSSGRSPNPQTGSSAAAPDVCPACASHVTASARFCNQCGARLTDR